MRCQSHISTLSTTNQTEKNTIQNQKPYCVLVEIPRMPNRPLSPFQQRKKNMVHNQIQRYKQEIDEEIYYYKAPKELSDSARWVPIMQKKKTATEIATEQILSKNNYQKNTQSFAQLVSSSLRAKSQMVSRPMTRAKSIYKKPVEEVKATEIVEDFEIPEEIPCDQ